MRSRARGSGMVDEPRRARMGFGFGFGFGLGLGRWWSLWAFSGSGGMQEWMRNGARALSFY